MSKAGTSVDIRAFEEQMKVRRTKKTVLEDAIKTVADRGVPYGGVEDNFQRIANLWTTHMTGRYGTGPEMFKAFDAIDVAIMMVLMKVGRLQASPNHADSWTDIAGYAACGGELAERTP